MLTALAAQQSQPGNGQFEVRLYEDQPSNGHWSFEGLSPVLQWKTPFAGFSGLPGKLSPTGFTMKRDKPFAVQLQGEIRLPAGTYDFTLRSRNQARFYLDGNVVLASEPPKPKKLTPEEVAAQQAEENKQKDEAAKDEARRQLQEQIARENQADPALEFNESVLKAVQQELIKSKRTLGLEKSDTSPPKEMEMVSGKVTLAEGLHRVRLEFFGTQSEVEVSVAFRRGAEPMRLLSLGPVIRFSEKGWDEWAQLEKDRVQTVVDDARKPLQQAWEALWRQKRAALGAEFAATGESVDSFIDAKLAANRVTPAPVITEYEFLRRIYLDAWGLIPTAEQVKEFISDKRANKRELLIDRLVSDARWADPWVAYWEDALAENPKTFGRVANSSGPFKRWIHRSFVEDRGFDRFATELILMEGTDREQGTLGFAESLENDAPMAEKAFVLSQAFMAANMKCARCHDSPLNSFRQRDLFGLAAMLYGKPVAIPGTSSVGAVPGRRAPAVKVTTKPGELIAASFVFDAGQQVASKSDGRKLREDFAARLTAHRRFADVGVNRIWKRFMGTGLVEPVDDWPAKYRASHPELLDLLSREFIRSGYSVRHIEKLILGSKAYQRSRVPDLAGRKDTSGFPLFAAQPVRRMQAEEVVDSLHLSVRRPFKTERMAYAAVDYGYPKRLWEVVTLSNEEDNAILARPLLQEIIAAAIAFGWRDQRPDPRSVRDTAPNPLQPLTLANGALVTRLVRLTDASFYARLAAGEIALNEFTDQLFLNTLSRLPSERERGWAEKKLNSAWSTRRVSTEMQSKAMQEKPIPMVRDMLEAYRYLSEARQAEPAAQALTADFRKSFEGVLWVILNSPEFLFVP